MGETRPPRWKTRRREGARWRAGVGGWGGVESKEEESMWEGAVGTVGTVVVAARRMVSAPGSEGLTSGGEVSLLVMIGVTPDMFVLSVAEPVKMQQGRQGVRKREEGWKLPCQTIIDFDRSTDKPNILRHSPIVNSRKNLPHASPR